MMSEWKLRKNANSYSAGGTVILPDYSNLADVDEIVYSVFCLLEEWRIKEYEKAGVMTSYRYLEK